MALCIQGGEVFDGSGGEAQRLDVRVVGDRVVALGRGLAGPDDEVIDASHCWVCPGFLDTHTHYDAELALAPGLIESVRHGVTTVVVGSCSISFVTAEAEDCADLFTRVEGVPREVVLPLLSRVKSWSDPAGWRSWVEGVPLGPNVASFLGHSDLRTRALGLLRAVDGRVRPNVDELALMIRLLEQAMDVGFLGMSSMTNPWDRLDGDRAWSSPLPSVFASFGERRQLEARLRARGFIHQSAPNLVTRYNVLGMVWSSGGRWRRPLKTTLITLMDLKADPWVAPLARGLAWLANQVLGGDLRWQTLPVPFDLYYDGMDSVLFEEFPTGQEIRHQMRDAGARQLLLKDPAWQERFRREISRRLAPKVWHRDLGDARVLAAPDPTLVGKSFAEIGAARGMSAVDTFLDLMIRYDRELRWHTCLANHRPEVLAELLQLPEILVSFADSGAHLRNMAFYNFPLRMLGRARRAQQAGRPFLTVGQTVRRLTRELADWFGLDAGRLEVGARADLVVVDPRRLDGSEERVSLRPYAPGLGFDRLVNEGEAAREVLVGGQRLIVGGAPTIALGQRRAGRFLAARP